jgi:hypothetical protein
MEMVIRILAYLAGWAEDGQAISKGSFFEYEHCRKIGISETS